MPMTMSASASASSRWGSVMSLKSLSSAPSPSGSISLMWVPLAAPSCTISFSKRYLSMSRTSSTPGVVMRTTLTSPQSLILGARVLHMAMMAFMARNWCAPVDTRLAIADRARRSMSVSATVVRTMAFEPSMRTRSGGAFGLPELVRGATMSTWNVTSVLSVLTADFPRFHGRRMDVSEIGTECRSMMLWNPGFRRVMAALSAG
mmetsp:Transcript_26370/g.79233  ORF Transcript_26370/g.79233 Transcript_26370/m.79233 type:complete len:204 (+) Transcript_26370:112-723(+)